jgi:uncharacterized membrane protein (UPF0127 family)
VLGWEALVATSWRSRLLGLAHLDLEAAPAGLLIPRCRCVHTFGMRFALDVLFLDEAGAVVERRLAVPPRRHASCGKASAVLEIPTGKGGEIERLLP